MTILAISTAASVLAIAGLIVGVVVLALVLALFNRVVGPAKEIDLYAQDILAGGIGIATNLDGVEKLAQTRALATAVPGLAVAYLKKLGLA